jgi:competence protein ComEA
MGLSRRQLIAYAVLAALVIAIGVKYLVAGDGGADRGEAIALTEVSGGAASPQASVAPSPQGTAPLVVYVCGAVRAPGVYTFSPGARVADLIDRAGGATGAAALETINLAALLTDGQQIVVPRRGDVAAGAPPAPGADASAGAASVTSAGATQGSGAVTGGAASLVNLNTASLSELDALPGVGPSTAQKIVDYRTANGGFKSVDDLKNVSGIGDVRFAELKDLVTV